VLDPAEVPGRDRIRSHGARDLRREPTGRRHHRRREGPGRDRPQGVRGGTIPAVRDA
jgi:hypothetical protein